MARFIVMAEEGEHELLDQVKEKLGLDLSDAELIYTGVGAINVIQHLQHLDREAEIYNIGYAGSANFDIGTWVEVTEVRLNHPAVSYSEPELKIVVRRYAIRIAILCCNRITRIACLIWNWHLSPRWDSRTCTHSNM